MAQKMYSRQEVEALDVDGVVKFAQEQGLDQEDVAVLRKQKIDGSVLERMTAEKLERYGMPGGPAEKLMKALDKVFGRGSSGDTENKGQVNRCGNCKSVFASDTALREHLSLRECQESPPSSPGDYSRSSGGRRKRKREAVEMSVKIQYRPKGTGRIHAKWINYDSTDCKASTVLELAKTTLNSAKEVLNLPAQEVISNMELSALPWHTQDTGLAWYVKTTKSPDDKPSGPSSIEIVGDFEDPLQKVFRAFHRPTHRECVVKVSSKHLIAHEVNMLRRVAVCNGVCTLVWTGQVANHSALAVTPCGTPLPAYFKEWSSQELIDVATDVFRTLCSIHDLGVLHRDVKPDNIVIFKGKAVLCDFDAAVDTADVYAPVHATPLFTAPPEEMAERGAQWVDFAGLCYTMFLVEQGKSQPEWSSVPSIDNLAAQSSLVRHIVWLWDHVGEDSMTSSSL